MNSKMNLVKFASVCFALFGAASVLAAQIGGGAPSTPAQQPTDTSQTNTGAVSGTGSGAAQRADTAPAASRDGYDREGKSNSGSRNGSAQNSPPADTGGNRTHKAPKHKK